jgi:hypothetical protein
MIASCGYQLRVLKIVSTLSTISAIALMSLARSQEAFSPGRPFYANATAPGSTSQLEL